MILKLLTKQFLQYLQCSDYTTTDKVTAPIFVVFLWIGYLFDSTGNWFVFCMEAT